MPAIQTIDALQSLRRDLGPCPRLTREEEYRLIPLAQAGDADARERLLCSCAPAMILVASRTFKQFRDSAHGIDVLSDIVQEALMTLHKVIDRFDPARGTRLCTLPMRCAGQQCRLAVCNMTGIVRVNMVARRNHAAPEDSPCFRGYSVREIEDDEIPDREHDGVYEERARRTTAQRRLVLEGAPPDDAIVLSMRMDGLTLKEIGRHYGVSRERARQKIIEAIERAKERLAGRQWPGVG
jgi:RNA polymerase sigma factor (sigma-70 family)